MKIIFASVLLMCIIAAAFGAGCDVNGKKYKVGEKFYPSGECTVVTCNGDNNISALTCPAMSAPPSCKHIPQDNSKPYPKCCERYDC